MRSRPSRKTVHRMGMGEVASEGIQGKDLGIGVTLPLPSVSMSILLRPPLFKFDAEKKAQPAIEKRPRAIMQRQKKLRKSSDAGDASDWALIACGYTCYSVISPHSSSSIACHCFSQIPPVHSSNTSNNLATSPSSSRCLPCSPSRHRSHFRFWILRASPLLV
jgi:hypothetical protein